MKNLFNERKQKIISTLIVTTGALIGFEAVSYTIGLYQLRSALFLSLYIYAFHILWLTFLFDLHLKKRGVLANARLSYSGLRMLWYAFKDRCAHIRRWEYLRHYQNYLVLPGILYWSAVTLLLLNPFKDALKQIIVFTVTAALSVAYWYMKEHVSRALEHREHWIKILALVKLFAAFVVYCAILGAGFYFGYEPSFFLMATFTVTFLLVYQALFQHRLLNFNIFIWIVIVAGSMSVVSLWVLNNWNTEYWTGGLFMVAVYNLFWGILHHHLDRTLTKRVAFEYLIMMILVVSLVFGSHNFNQRVI